MYNETMYNELIKNLRVAGDFVSLSGYQRDLMRKAADAIEDLSEPRWIPVTELPENESLLGKLICDSEGQIRIAYRVTTIGLKDKVIHTDSIDGLMLLAEECATPISEWADCTHITHYMPLPEPPKEEA